MFVITESDSVWLIDNHRIMVVCPWARAGSRWGPATRINAPTVEMFLDWHSHEQKSSSSSTRHRIRAFFIFVLHSWIYKFWFCEINPRLLLASKFGSTKHLKDFNNSKSFMTDFIAHQRHLRWKILFECIENLCSFVSWCRWQNLASGKFPFMFQPPLD